MTWLNTFAYAAQKTDRFAESAEHLPLLAAGLMGEAGSVLTELKKEKREGDAYPGYRRSKMHEEIGDFLWYFIRLVSVVDKSLIAELETTPGWCGDKRSVSLFLELGAAVGDVLALVSRKNEASAAELRPSLLRVWSVLTTVSREVQVPLQAAAEGNTRKIESRWPSEHIYAGLFDDDCPEEEQLPRRLDVEFRERARGQQRIMILRCNGINFGDQLTDNIRDPDGYRYHDVFHFAHAVHLGWSPVVRALLRCKRKSSPKLDEGEDGARAVILEEAISAIVFSRAKERNFFEGLEHLDYDLLKTIKEFVQGYEVERVPLWQWETAILDGYATFRRLLANRGGRAILDLRTRQLTYMPSP
ncbi:MAG: pyrophosphatase [Planctomycetota bacterium]